MILAHAVSDTLSWINASLIFVAFCATASGTYILNDIVDLPADRQHPLKSHRPLASGTLPKSVALSVALFLIILGCTIAAKVGALPLIVIYILASVSYSLAFKTIAIVDVFVLSTFYVLRLLAGGVATGHPVSLWLLTFSGFLFLSLGLAKRVAEIMAIGDTDNGRALARRGYQRSDTNVLQIIGISSTFASGIVLALFVGSTSASAEYQAPSMLWLSVPLIVFWLCRLWLQTARGNVREDPLEYAMHDWASWVLGATLIVIFAIASYGPNIPSLRIVRF